MLKEYYKEQNGAEIEVFLLSWHQFKHYLCQLLIQSRDQIFLNEQRKTRFRRHH